MKQYLIKFDSNYADEFDVRGFVVMSEDEWDAHKKVAAKLFDKNNNVEIYFGTNESLDFLSLEDYINSFNLSEITDQEHDFLKKHFSRYNQVNYGIIPMIENYDE